MYDNCLALVARLPSEKGTITSTLAFWLDMEHFLVLGH